MASHQQVRKDGDVLFAAQAVFTLRKKMSSMICSANIFFMG